MSEAIFAQVSYCSFCCRAFAISFVSFFWASAFFDMVATGQTVAAIMHARNVANVLRLRTELKAALAAQAVTGKALALERAGWERQTFARLKAWRASGGAAVSEVAGAGGVAGKGKAVAAGGGAGGAGGVAGTGKGVAAVGVAAGGGGVAGRATANGNGKKAVTKAALRGAAGASVANSKRSWPSDVPVPEATRKRGRPDLRPDVCKQFERQAAGKPGGVPHALFCTKVKYARIDRP